LLDDSDKYSAMKTATIGLAIPNSTNNIIREIAALLPETQEKSRAQPVTVAT
jgi:hypothetical protein